MVRRRCCARRRRVGRHLLRKPGTTELHLVEGSTGCPHPAVLSLFEGVCTGGRRLRPYDRATGAHPGAPRPQLRQRHRQPSQRQARPEPGRQPDRRHATWPRRRRPAHHRRRLAGLSRVGVGASQHERVAVPADMVDALIGEPAPARSPRSSSTRTIAGTTPTARWPPAGVAVAGHRYRLGRARRRQRRAVGASCRSRHRRERARRRRQAGGRPAPRRLGRHRVHGRPERAPGARTAPAHHRRAPLLPRSGAPSDRRCRPGGAGRRQGSSDVLRLPRPAEPGRIPRRDGGGARPAHRRCRRRSTPWPTS